MTWEPKNGLNDEDVDVSDEEEVDTSFKEDKSRTGEHIDSSGRGLLRGWERLLSGEIERGWQVGKIQRGC